MQSELLWAERKAFFIMASEFLNIQGPLEPGGPAMIVGSEHGLAQLIVGLKEGLRTKEYRDFKLTSTDGQEYEVVMSITPNCENVIPFYPGAAVAEEDPAQQEEQPNPTRRPRRPRRND